MCMYMYTTMIIHLRGNFLHMSEKFSSGTIRHVIVENQSTERLLIPDEYPLHDHIVVCIDCTMYGPYSHRERRDLDRATLVTRKNDNYIGTSYFGVSSMFGWRGGGLDKINNKKILSQF